MIFVDTGAFLGRYLPDDQHHAEAQAGWRHLAETRQACCTSTLVLSETITLLARRADYAFAADKARIIHASSVLRILRPTAQDEITAIGWLDKFADQHVSFTDAVSFALMKRHRLTKVFTFDRHFGLAGFKQIT